MIYEKKGEKHQKGHDGRSKSELEAKDLSEQVPEIDSVLADIDKLLLKNTRQQQLEIDICGC